MNCFDYLFEKSSSLEKNFIIGCQETSAYNYIYQASIHLASFLLDKVGKGKNIILVSQNSSFFIIAYLGILKSGNICVPLNPSIEQKNFDFILNKTNCKLGFISEFVKKNLEVSIDFFSEKNFQTLIRKPDSAKEKELKIDFDENQVAEIIFTSGSTSTPKGVMLTHKNIISNTNSIIQYLKLTEEDKMLVVLPFFYCYGLSLLHTHLRVGGQLVLNNNFIFLASTINNLNKYKCTGFAGVPSHFQILLRKTDLFRNTKFPMLRYVTQAGGKLPNAFINEFIEAFPTIPFFVMYGQTEATARLSFLPPEKLADKLGSIGKGIPGVELKVVDIEGKKVLPGKTGEIIAKGENVMLGYFDDNDETNLAIRNGWLYTGDLAQIDKDGYIYITSRKKEIMKVGGKRISPKEIEEVLYMIPGVIDCTIEEVEDDILNQAVKARITFSDEEKYHNEEYFRQFCQTRLAQYKIPKYFEFKTEVSISATGKKIKPG